MLGDAAREDERAACCASRPPTRLPRGLALLDAPDIDSLVADNRDARRRTDLRRRHLGAWSPPPPGTPTPCPGICCAPPRSTTSTLVTVLDRVPHQVVAEVSRQYGALLTKAGLGDVPRFTVPELPESARRRRAAARPPPSPRCAPGSATSAQDPARPAAGRRPARRTACSTRSRSRMPELAGAAAAQHAAALRLTARRRGGVRQRARARAGPAAGRGAVLAGDALTRWRGYPLDCTAGELLDALAESLAALLLCAVTAADERDRRGLAARTRRAGARADGP